MTDYGDVRIGEQESAIIRAGLVLDGQPDLRTDYHRIYSKYKALLADIQRVAEWKNRSPAE